MAAAIEATLRDHEQEQEREAALRDRLWEIISRNVPEARRNGDSAHRLANTLNVSFPGASSETLLMALDLEGVCASSGSACMVGSVVTSHVLLAMGLPPALAGAAVRFSLGKGTTAEEVENAGEAIARILKRFGQADTRRQSDAHVAV
jgi:cysteine desulfurase